MNQNLNNLHPVYSMTGFATESHAELGLSVDCRSVNSRFLDLQIKTPENFRHLDMALREKLQAIVKRGKVELRVQLSAVRMAPKTDSRQAWDADCAQLSCQQAMLLERFPTARPLDIGQILHQLQNMHSTPTNPASDAQVLRCVDGALQTFLQTRAAEGAQLRFAMLEIVGQLRNLHQLVAPMIPAVIAAQKQKFLDRFAQAAKDASHHTPISETALQDKALAEAAAFAIRIDVQEEMTRLAVHLDDIDLLLQRGGEVGKRLEFVIQELHREANTLGSKSASLDTTRIAVDMKVLIEQLREQIQNIE